MRSGLFKIVLATLKNERMLDRSPTRKSANEKPWRNGNSPPKDPFNRNMLLEEIDEEDDDFVRGGRYSMSPGNKGSESNKRKTPDDNSNLHPNREKSVNQRQNEKNNDLTLAITVLLANISVDNEFMKDLLGDKSLSMAIAHLAHTEYMAAAEPSFWESHERHEEEKAWQRLDERIR